MADEEKFSEKNKSSTEVSDPPEGKKDSTSHADERCSLEESEQIGKIVIDTLKSELQSYFSNESVENVKDPHVKAWKYIEETHALHFLEVLLSRVVFERPDNPFQFMIDEVNKMRKTQEKEQSTTIADAKAECDEKVQE